MKGMFSMAKRNYNELYLLYAGGAEATFTAAALSGFGSNFRKSGRNPKPFCSRA